MNSRRRLTLVRQQALQSFFNALLSMEASLVEDRLIQYNLSDAKVFAGKGQPAFSGFVHRERFP